MTLIPIILMIVGLQGASMQNTNDDDIHLSTNHVEPYSTTSLAKPNSTAIYVEPYPTTNSDEPLSTTNHAEPTPTTIHVERLQTTNNIEPHLTTIHVEPHPTTNRVEPHLTTNIVEPYLSTIQVETQKTTKNVEPHLSTSHTESHLTTTHVKPHSTNNHIQPHLTTINVDPHLTTSHIQPHLTSNHIQPYLTTNHAQLHLTTSHAQPQTTTNHVQPHPTTNHSQLHLTTIHAQIATTKHVQPHPTTNHVQPHPTTNHSQLHLTTIHAQPHATTKHVQPHSTTNHVQPHSTTNHSQPHLTTIHAQPHATTKHVQPHPTTKHVQPHPTTTHAQTQTTNSKRINLLKKTVASLARQLMLQQVAAEERIRAEGYSGVKQLRHNNDGTRPYYGATHTGSSVNAIHDHDNYDRTCGMGEVQAVINGVEFRTRHNDYKLSMPDPNSKAFNKMVDIPFPPVPPSVLNKHTLNEQIAEMKEYFRAFQHQDTHIRDWVPYFKPVLCYMEGGWTMNTKTLVEPFKSDRHFIDAASWMELQEKIRYTGYTGGKNQFENLSYLPTTIINVTEDGIPVYAQWNYRIACHPIKRFLGLKHLRLVDDLSVRMAQKNNMSEFFRNRASRFTVSPMENPSFDWRDGYGQFRDQSVGYDILDQIMYEIPGKDNYLANITDNSFGQEHYDVHEKENKLLNTGYYHRWFKVANPGAMGLTVRHRGYSDQFMFTAHTTHPEIAEMSVYNCEYNSDLHKQVCDTYRKRVTYAIPLEIIWMTPLQLWNPYDLEMRKEDPHKIATQGGRNGGFTADTAYNGSSLSIYYLTPAEFFEGGAVGRDPADTAKDAVGVLDKNGTVRRLVGSGVKIFTPNIPGVGRLRLRYPIVPIHVEGSPTFKELDALKTVLMDMNQYPFIFEHKPSIPATDVHAPLTRFTMQYGSNNIERHTHNVILIPEDMAALKSGNNSLHILTSEYHGHSHDLEIHYNHRTNRFEYLSCDNNPHCLDGHGNLLYQQPV
ncbi:hypothetical protein CHS0354_025653 [Potamilus streckersoni]|uniref:Uncharacterized protein n=1 Tax=Potamilus streckersoni TaxID=2493646 RepID=A0AAE0VM96_9BIVA|nr:hypothetical protein CHS0354_025653 [Potamilus streckersoni]